VPAVRLVGLWLTSPADTSKPEADARTRDSAQLPAPLVRLPDGRPRSGRTPDKMLLLSG